MENKIEFTRVNNDNAGNPRYVCHFLNFILKNDKGDIKELYQLALSRSRKFFGKKYHTKNFGGGIVFQCYNLQELNKRINEMLQEIDSKTK